MVNPNKVCIFVSQLKTDNQMKNKTVTAKIKASIPILKRIPYDGFVLNLGSLTLSLGKRNFVLDSKQTDFNNPRSKGKNFTFETELEVDLETFKEGKEYNYKLTEKDLANKELETELFCETEDGDETEDCFDFECANVELVITVDGKDYKIENITLD